jgi:hypothetical protein
MDRRRIVENIAQAKAELAIHLQALEDEFGVSGLVPAEKLLERLETKQEKLEKKLENAVEEYETKWEHLLNE